MIFVLCIYYWIQCTDCFTWSLNMINFIFIIFIEKADFWEITSDLVRNFSI